MALYCVVRWLRSRLLKKESAVRKGPSDSGLNDLNWKRTRSFTKGDVGR